jgi:PAH dioxygenase large subunit
MLANTPPSISALFPATAIVMLGGQLGGPVGQTITLRFFTPISPNKTQVLSFSLVERDVSEELKELIHSSSISSFGTGGIFETDDVEIWAGVQRGVEGVIGRQMFENYQSIGDPLESDPLHPGAATFRGISTDDNQWLFYERYFEFMENRAW